MQCFHNSLMLTNACAGPATMEDQPILSFDLQECQRLLTRMEDQWVIFDTPAPDFQQIFERVTANMGEATTTNQYIGVVKKIREQTAQLYLRLNQLGVIKTDDQLRFRTNRLMEVVGFCVVLINTTHRTQQAIEDSSDPTDIGSTFYSFSSMTDVEGEDVKTYQRLLLHLFCQAQMHGYRRYGDSVYEPILTADNYNTHSWNRVSDIRTFIYMSCQKEFHFNEWRLLTDHPSYPKNAESYLTSCEDSQFPRLVKNRNAFSFPNGIYLTTRDKWVPFGSGASMEIPSGLCCAKHFENPLPPEHAGNPIEAWRDIPTPAFDTMLESQELLGEISDWLLVFIGRLLYEVGEMDNWYVRIPCTCGDSAHRLWPVDNQACKYSSRCGQE